MAKIWVAEGGCGIRPAGLRCMRGARFKASGCSSAFVRLKRHRYQHFLNAVYAAMVLVVEEAAKAGLPAHPHLQVLVVDLWNEAATDTAAIRKQIGLNF